MWSIGITSIEMAETQPRECHLEMKGLWQYGPFYYICNDQIRVQKNKLEFQLVHWASSPGSGLLVLVIREF